MRRRWNVVGGPCLQVDAGYVPRLKAEQRGAPISELPRDAPTPQVKRYAYRSFDRQWILADTRLADYLRPDLWRAHGERQVYFTSLLSKFLGVGPALSACAVRPDLDHFSGRGAKDTLPLYRTADASEPNILPGLLDQLTQTYGREITPEDFAAYLYGVLAHPAFTEHYSEQLETRELRVPMTRDRGLFEALLEAGVKLLRLHSYGERFVPDGEPRGRVPPGSARCTKAVPGNADDYPESFRHDAEARTLHVGRGEFSGVAPEVFEFEVSGLKVVQSWLRYRMKNGSARRRRISCAGACTTNSECSTRVLTARTSPLGLTWASSDATTALRTAAGSTASRAVIARAVPPTSSHATWRSITSLPACAAGRMRVKTSSCSAGTATG